MDHVKPFRSPWNDGFMDILIHASESLVKQHPSYPAAKAGDVFAALDLVQSRLNDDTITALVELGEEKSPILVSVHAEEMVGVNAIPEVMADMLSFILGWEVEKLVVQANVVNHTGAGGFGPLVQTGIF